MRPAYDANPRTASAALGTLGTCSPFTKIWSNKELKDEDLAELFSLGPEAKHHLA